MSHLQDHNPHSTGHSGLSIPSSDEERRQPVCSPLEVARLGSKCMLDLLHGIKVVSSTSVTRRVNMDRLSQYFKWRIEMSSQENMMTKIL
jgi:hypothetical protein